MTNQTNQTNQMNTNTSASNSGYNKYKRTNNNNQNRYRKNTHNTQNKYNANAKKFSNRKRTTSPKKNVKFSKYLSSPNTVYNFLKRFAYKKIEFSKKDLRKISNSINARYNESFKDKAPLHKVLQLEGDKVYIVYVYPKIMIKEMNNICTWFYRVKERRVQKHNEQAGKTENES